MPLASAAAAPGGSPAATRPHRRSAGWRRRRRSGANGGRSTTTTTGACSARCSTARHPCFRAQPTCRRAPPSDDAVLVTCAYLSGGAPVFVEQSLFLAAIGEARDKGARALEAFAYRYPADESTYERFLVHRTVFPRDFLEDFGFLTLRVQGNVELMRLELGGLQPVEEGRRAKSFASCRRHSRPRRLQWGQARRESGTPIPYRALRATQISSLGQRCAHSADTKSKRGTAPAGGAHLDQVFDDEAVSVQQLDPLAVRRVELDRTVLGILDPVRREVVCARGSASAGPPSAGVQAIGSAPLAKNTSRPPGRSRRCASGIHRPGSHQRLAPYSETARSKLSSATESVSAFSQTSGNDTSNSRWNRRTIPSCARAMSTATDGFHSAPARRKSTPCRSPARQRRRPARGRPETSSDSRGVPRCPTAVPLPARLLALQPRAGGPSDPTLSCFA